MGKTRKNKKQKPYVHSMYFINLASSTDRHTAFMEQAKKLELPFKRWEGLDATVMSNKEFIKQYQPDGPEGVSYWALNPLNEKRKREIACFISHRGIWRDIVKRGVKSNAGVLICEDDVIFPADFHTKLDSALKALPSDWDGLWIGYNLYDWFHKTSAIGKLKNWTGCYAYILRETSIPKLLPYVDIVSEPVDCIFHHLARQGLFTIYAAPQSFVTTGLFKSTLRAETATIEHKRKMTRHKKKMTTETV
jgi:GR25 family glycosyltransferase involved in LPS biosynthesis